MIMRSFAIAAAALAMSGTAYAADMPLKTSPVGATPVYLDRLLIGGDIGAVFMRDNSTVTDPSNSFNLTNNLASGASHQ